MITFIHGAELLSLSNKVTVLRKTVDWPVSPLPGDYVALTPGWDVKVESRSFSIEGNIVIYLGKALYGQGEIDSLVKDGWKK